MGTRKNYLDYIPVYTGEFVVSSGGLVTIFRENKGPWNRLAQHVLRRAKVTQIHLDAMGSLAFLFMDGTLSIYDIGKKVHAVFGQAADPLYSRLARFFQILHENGLITYAKI